MPQYVLEFGAVELAPVAEAVISWMGEPDLIEVAARQANGPQYERTDDELSRVIDRLRDNSLISAILRNDTPGVRYGLIVAPHFCGQALSLWMGTLEATVSDWKPMWRAVLSNNQLRFACLGAEEGVELTDNRLDPGSFPWFEWPMIIGALRSPDGNWIVRENTAKRPSR